MSQPIYSYKKYFLILCLALILPSFGCAVHYFDEDTLTEHIWGFGHMKMKVSAPQEGLKAAVSGSDLYGFGISKGREEFSLIGGMNRTNYVGILDDDASLRLEWPSSDFFKIRVGTRPPFAYKPEDFEKYDQNIATKEEIPAPEPQKNF